MQIVNQSEISRVYWKGDRLFVSQKTAIFRRYQIPDDTAADIATGMEDMPPEILDGCINELLELARRFNLKNYYQASI